MEPTSILTVADAIATARAAHDALAELAEDAADEWSYVTDLTIAWRERLDEVVVVRGDEPAGDAVAAAIEAVTAEAAAIDDPHRAIDWLSTLPQIVLIALGERP